MDRMKKTKMGKNEYISKQKKYSNAKRKSEISNLVIQLTEPNIIMTNPRLSVNGGQRP